MANIRLVVGTVSGKAQSIADAMAQELSHQHKVVVTAQAALEDITDEKMDTLLIVCSTTGSGDIPANLVGLFYELRERFPLLPNLQYGVVALGDRSFGDTFCGAGKQWDELLTELTAKPLGAMLALDACDSVDPWTRCQEWLKTTSLSS
jgi:flavodoxin